MNGEPCGGRIRLPHRSLGEGGSFACHGVDGSFLVFRLLPIEIIDDLICRKPRGSRPLEYRDIADMRSIPRSLNRHSSRDARCVSPSTHHTKDNAGNYRPLRSTWIVLDSGYSLFDLARIALCELTIDQSSAAVPAAATLRWWPE